MVNEQVLNSRIICKTISIHASVTEVWDALTKPELMKQWMSDTEIEIESGWKAGSPFVIRGSSHGSFENKGVILELVPGKIFSYNYLSSISNLPDEHGNYSVITFELAAVNDQTAVTFTQSNFVAEASYEHADFYWGIALQVLKRFVEQK